MDNRVHNVRTAIQFSTGWTAAWTPSFNSANEIKTARSWQLNALDKIFDQPLSSVYAPPATGKGVLICLNAYLTLEAYPEMKAIIVAPQRNITKDLRKQRIKHPFDPKAIIEWEPTCYLNDTSKNTMSNTAAFKEWASRPIVECWGVNSRVCVMTHQSLCRIFANGEKDNLKNVILFLDEFHHVFLSETSNNRLGQVLRYFIDNINKKNLRVCMLTATPFRGDRLAPIPRALHKQVAEFSHPMDEAMPDFAPLQHFGLDFVLYKKTWKESIKSLVGKKLAPSIFYIPSVNSAYSVGDKNGDVMEVYRAISGTDNPEIRKEQIFTLVYSKSERRWLRCIDLVDDTVNRERKLNAVADDHDRRERTKDSIDAIIALDMLIEGANWKWAVNEYIIGNHDSLREFIQMYGRLFRAAPKKKKVHCYYLLAYSQDFDTEEYVENFNTYMKAVFLTLILVNVLQPQLVSTVVREQNGEGEPRRNYLNETFSETDQINYMEAAQEAILDAAIARGIEVDLEAGIGNNITEEQMNTLRDALDSVLDQFEVRENREQVKRETMRIFKIASLIPLIDVTGLDVEEFDFDFIENSNIHPLTCMVMFGSGMRDVNTLKELRLCTDRLFRDFERDLRLFTEFKNKHGHLRIPANYVVEV
jgi:superfamily II DNA or RNA helicase